MKRYLTLDLETVADAGLVSAVDGEPARPYAEQLERLVQARREKGSKSDFLPLPYHRPVAACLLEAADDGGALLPVDVHAWTEGKKGEPEAAFLARTWERIHGRTLVTFHGRGFDLPVLELRSLKLGVPAPTWFAGSGRRRGSAEHRDVYELLTNDGAASAAPLDLYAKLLGLPGKEDTAGKDVQALHAQGALDRIAAYCMTDVVQTWLLYLRLRLVDGTLAPDGYARSLAGLREVLPGLFHKRLGAFEREHLAGFLVRCAPFLEGEIAAPRAAVDKATSGKIAAALALQRT